MSRPLRVLVTGSRDYPEPFFVSIALNRIVRPRVMERHDVVIVHGACPKGVDRFASNWVRHCQLPGVTEEAHPAEWKSYGKSAGFRRNVEMVALGADVCLAFIANGSPGSTHCADAAQRAHIPTLRFRIDGPTDLLVPAPGLVDPHPEGGS